MPINVSWVITGLSTTLRRNSNGVRRSGIISLFILLVLGGTPYSGKAESWVQVTRTTDVSPNGYKYDYNYQWSFENQDLAVPTCASGCLVKPFYEGGVIHVHQDVGITIKAGECSTIKCIFKRWEKEMPLVGTGSIVTGQSGARDSCWSFQSFPFRGSYPTGSGVKLPGSVCGTAPPPNVSCSITPEAVAFNFPPTASSELNGVSLSLPLNISCTEKEVSARILLSSGKKIPMGKSDSYEVYALLELDGRPLNDEGVEVKVTNSNTTFNLKSILYSSGEVPGGEYSGSTALIMNVL